jgi:lipoate-protein ligase A
MLKILNSGRAPAAENMALDAHLLESLDPVGDPILHLYEWEGLSATYGHFIDPKKHLDLEAAERHGLSLARRPTGGGIVFHVWDLAFSFLMPSAHPRFSSNTLDNYHFVNSAVLEAVKPWVKNLELIPLSPEPRGADCQNFCMAKPTQFDVIHEERKIAGAAQRKTTRGYLHQGTISLAFPDVQLLSDVLISKAAVLEAMLFYTSAPLGPDSTPKMLDEARAEMQKRLTEKLQDAL